MHGSGQKISGEIIPMAVLVTNGVEEGSLGMVTTFVTMIRQRWSHQKHSSSYASRTLPNQV